MKFPVVVVLSAMVLAALADGLVVRGNQPAETEASEEQVDKLSERFMDELEAKIKEDLANRPDLARELNAPVSEEAQGGGKQQDEGQKKEASGGEGLGEAEVVEKVRQLQQQFQQIPKALKQLLWGNESAQMEADLSDLVTGGRATSRKTVMDSQLACVMACESSSADETLIADYGCDQLEEQVGCTAKCRPGAYANYAYNMLKTLKKEHCSFSWHPDHANPFSLANYRRDMKRRAQLCAGSVLANKLKVLKGVQQFVQCYVEMEEASGPKEACYALKYCVIESTAGKILDWCEDESLASSMKSGSVQMLTALSHNGNLIRECPELYTID